MGVGLSDFVIGMSFKGCPLTGLTTAVYTQKFSNLFFQHGGKQNAVTKFVNIVDI